MLEESELERDVVQLAVREAVSVALTTPLGEPIREAVAAAEGDRAGESPSGADDRSTEPDEEAVAIPDGPASGQSALRLGAGAAALFVALYVAIRWLTDDEL